MKRALITVFILSLLAAFCAAQQATPAPVLPKGAKVFIAPMDDNFQEFLIAAFKGKKVPLTIVDDKAKADFEITGHSETQKASTAKKVIMWDWRSNEQATVQVANIKSGDVVWAYSVNKTSSAHGKKSTAEACAKHLNEKIESGK
jgi:hypothetical protein